MGWLGLKPGVSQAAAFQNISSIAPADRHRVSPAQSRPQRNAPFALRRDPWATFAQLSLLCSEAPAFSASSASSMYPVCFLCVPKAAVTSLQFVVHWVHPAAESFGNLPSKGFYCLPPDVELGLLLAFGLIRTLIRQIPPNLMDGMPYLHTLGFNMHLAYFAAAVSLLGRRPLLHRSGDTFLLFRYPRRPRGKWPHLRRQGLAQAGLKPGRPLSWPSPWCFWSAQAC